MRILVVALMFFMAIISCRSYKPQENISSNKIDFSTLVNGKIYRIDSLNNYNLYLSNGAASYKIISEKTSSIDCKKVTLDSSYELKIVPHLSDAPPVSGNSNIPTPINHLDIGRCIKLKENSEICTEPGITNLFTSPNLTGLCLTKIK